MKQARNPLEHFSAWFRRAIAQSPGDWLDAAVMTLATSASDGHVTARTVLLMGFGPEGFGFYTSYASEKSRQLSENPRAALLFYWPHVRRQVRIEGQVRKVSRAESARYFQARSRLSQLSAAISPQSRVISSRAILERRVRLLQDTLGKKPVPLPGNWGGYRVVPDVIEFWEGNESRLHDRLRYSRHGNRWRIERLAP